MRRGVDGTYSASNENIDRVPRHEDITWILITCDHVRSVCLVQCTVHPIHYILCYTTPTRRIAHMYSSQPKGVAQGWGEYICVIPEYRGGIMIYITMRTQFKPTWWQRAREKLTVGTLITLQYMYIKHQKEIYSHALGNISRDIPLRFSLKYGFIRV